MDALQFLPKGTRLHTYGARSGRFHWYGKFYLDPVDALAYTISRSPDLASGTKPVHLTTVILSGDTPLGQTPTDAELKPGRLGIPPRPPSPLSVLSDPTVPDLRIFWLHDGQFPYITDPETTLSVNVPKHDIHSNYYTYREFVMANATSWFILPVKPLPRLSHPTELLAYWTFIDTLFQEAGQSSVQEVFGRVFEFKDTPPPRLEHPELILSGQSSLTYLGLVNGRQVIHKEVDLKGGLQEALVIRYLNVILPRHTPLLLDFHFRNNSGQPAGVIILEFIDNAVSAQEFGIYSNLPASLYISYRRKMSEFLESELLAGVWGKDANYGNWLLKYPYDEQNPVIYRIDYGEGSCFLASHPTLTYTCKEDRSKLYNQLENIYGEDYGHAVIERNRSRSEEDRLLLSAYIEEIKDKMSFLHPVPVPK